MSKKESIQESILCDSCGKEIAEGQACFLTEIIADTSSCNASQSESLCKKCFDIQIQALFAIK